MPRKIQRSEIVDYQTYTDQRAQRRPAVLAAKALRRYQVGGCFTFLFENVDTLRYQVQEMMRVERIVREADIQHEIDTYNDLLGAPGELGCTLLIGIETPEERAVRLVEWLDLPGRCYLKLADGTRVAPRWDEAQVGETRLSSVQYFKFPVGAAAPVAIGIDLPEHGGEYTFTEAERAALAGDLEDSLA